jgi:hypothetical protein
MKVETLTRALTAVRQLIVIAGSEAADWREIRERRRRQEGAFLRGIVRREGSQHKAALVTGLSQSVISRTLDREGHRKERETAKAYRDATKQNVASPEPEKTSNVVPLRRRRPDWRPREPRRPEVRKWFQQYLGWSVSAQKTARMMIFNAEKGRLPDAAYFSDEPGSSASDSAVGPEERASARANRQGV